MATLKAGRRIWIPFVLAAVCLVIATWTGAVLTVILLVAALCLILDGALKWWEGAGGGMSGYRQ